MLLAIVVIAVALVLYREVPDIVRRQIYNDPVPLVVGDKNLIHVRQMPYLPSQHFVYRVYLPTDRDFEVCVGAPGEGEAFPVPSATMSIPAQPDRKEVKIIGLTCPADPEGLTQKFFIEAESYLGPHYRPIQVPLQRSQSSRIFRRVGVRTTESCPADQRVVLLRLFSRDAADLNAPLPNLNEFSAGKGFIVWIQPKSNEKN
ncbi:hypothetical protein [Anatilimnocola floriformis]|uniref:hypothetical protein n=1 Tax=Anatilimnocola floriformis TaxID=2948575 RepID=UPI0020C55F1A|nr:hypothetical protein [Anatilimnocola floriformis]